MQYPRASNNLGALTTPGSGGARGRSGFQCQARAAVGKSHLTGAVVCGRRIQTALDT